MLLLIRIIFTVQLIIPVVAALVNNAKTDNKLVHIPKATTHDVPVQQHHRRQFLQSIVSGSSAFAFSIAGLAIGSENNPIDETTTTTTTPLVSSSLDFVTYQVLPDSTTKFNPTLTPVLNKSFLQHIASSKGGTIWLGEHHNSIADHNLQLNIIEHLHATRQYSNSNGDTPQSSSIGIGLEQVQIQFQPVLDDFIAGRISMSELRKNAEWDKRWVWSFDIYEPIFTAARQLQIPLVALNVNSEDLLLVEENGLQGLSPKQLRQYIADAPGFANFMKSEQYKTYANYVIRPSYVLHQEMGLLQYTMDGVKRDNEMSFLNFFSGRILWDESMACNAYRWTSQNPGKLLIGLVGAVKFQNGIPARYSRYARNSEDCITVLLNPTLIDTRPPGSVSNSIESMSTQNPSRYTLQLRYVSNDDEPSEDNVMPNYGVLPLADYLVIG